MAKQDTSMYLESAIRFTLTKCSEACVVLFGDFSYLLILKTVICNQNLNISGKLWPIFKILDILKLYTEPGFWNTPWLNSSMLSELRNYQTKSVTLNLGHPVVSTDTLIMKGKGKGIDSCYSARLYLRILCNQLAHFTGEERLIKWPSWKHSTTQS